MKILSTENKTTYTTLLVVPNPKKFVNKKLLSFFLFLSKTILSKTTNTSFSTWNLTVKQHLFKLLIVALSSFEEGFFLGLLVGEGHFGGDGKQPQITLRMHVRHEKIFQWLQEKFPNSKLYGPYSHGGRIYYQWMARGSFLRQEIMPIIFNNAHFFDAHIKNRIEKMCKTYEIYRTEITSR